MDNKTIQDLAREVAEVLFRGNLFIWACGCCPIMVYKGVTFGRFKITPEGEVSYNTVDEYGNETTEGKFNLHG